MKNPPTTPDERLTREQCLVMESELAELRLRAEHGLLKRLVSQVGGAPMSAGEVADSMRALVAISR